MTCSVMVVTLSRFAMHDLFGPACPSAPTALCGPRNMLLQHYKQVTLDLSVSDTRVLRGSKDGHEAAHEGGPLGRKTPLHIETRGVEGP